MVVSLFLLVEPLLDLLPLPFLTIAKLIGLAWCLAAEPISGSRILFDQVLPFVFINILLNLASQIHPIWEEGRTRLDLWAKEATGSDVGIFLVNLWQQRENVLPLLNTHVIKSHLEYFNLFYCFTAQSGHIKTQGQVLGLDC